MLKLSSFKATLIFTVNPTPKSYINFHTQQRQIFIFLRPKPKPNIENHFKIFRSSNLAQAVHGLLWNVTIASALQLDFFLRFQKRNKSGFSVWFISHIQNMTSCSVGKEKKGGEIFTAKILFQFSAWASFVKIKADLSSSAGRKNALTPFSGRSGFFIFTKSAVSEGSFQAGVLQLRDTKVNVGFKEFCGICRVIFWMKFT